MGIDLQRSSVQALLGARLSSTLGMLTIAVNSQGLKTPVHGESTEIILLVINLIHSF